MNGAYSIIIPCFNEEKAIGALLKGLLSIDIGSALEIIVVDDCSSDSTGEEASRHSVKVLRNVSNFGYGYSLKRGISAASHQNIIIIDADGSYPVSSLPTLVAEYEKGFDMVVGARVGRYYRGSLWKRIGRFFFRSLSEFATGRNIPDINSGCRVFRKEVVMMFFDTLSSGFSFTTTITLAFMLNNRSVKYVSIEYHKRHGNSKVRYFRDTMRSLQIIVEAIIFYNPIKIFLLCSFACIAIALISLLITLASPWLASLFFATAVLALFSLQLGFIAVLLKFKLTKRQ